MPVEGHEGGGIPLVVEPLAIVTLEEDCVDGHVERLLHRGKLEVLHLHDWPAARVVCAASHATA